MGLSDFFKNIFGKKACAFCGKEVGMMHRTKIKNKEFICSECDDMCSFHIEKYRFTKDELAGHMEYMKRVDKLFCDYVSQRKSDLYPSPFSDMAIEFFDDAGFFRIRDRRHENSNGKKYPVELFRYDTVASYEPYLVEDEPTEQGKDKVFRECGIKIRFVGDMDVTHELGKGLIAHPYITKEIKVVFANSQREKENCGRYIDGAIHHFDYIFGVHDDEKGLFSFGMSKKEKRDLMGAVGFVKTAIGAIEIAKNDGEITEEQKEKIKDNMADMQDADTGGLAVFTRRADELENKLNQ